MPVYVCSFMKWILYFGLLFGACDGRTHMATWLVVLSYVALTHKSRQDVQLPPTILHYRIESIVR